MFSFARLHFATVSGLSLVVIAFIMGWAAPAARAVPLAPGVTVPLAGTTSAADPRLAGTVIADVNRAFEVYDDFGNLILTGVVQDRVVRSTLTGTLVFAQRIKELDDFGNDAWVMGFGVERFSLRTLDVDFRTDSLGSVGPNDVTRDGGAGASLFFGYDPNLIFVPNEGHSLSTLSDATHYAAIGVQTVYAQNDFGASIFAASIPNTFMPIVIGDMDCNGRVDFDDIDEFVFGLNDPTGYGRKFGFPPSVKGDADGDGDQDFDDIGGFVGILNSGSLTGGAFGVPEPPAILLAAVGAGLLFASPRLRRQQQLRVN